jgi:hypothetical protein
MHACKQSELTPFEFRVIVFVTHNSSLYPELSCIDDILLVCSGVDGRGAVVVLRQVLAASPQLPERQRDADAAQEERSPGAQGARFMHLPR